MFFKFGNNNQIYQINVSFFSLQAGLYYFQIVDWYATLYAVTFLGFLECIVIAWIYGTLIIWQSKAIRFSNNLVIYLYADM